MKSNRKKRLRKQFFISCLCFSMISISVLLLPLAGEGENNLQVYIGYAVGILFWLGLLAGIVTYLRLYRQNKKFIKEKVGKKSRPSCINFFRNKYAAVTDIVLCTSFVVMILGSIFIEFPVGVDVIVFCLFITSTYLHFLLNGNVFYIISFVQTETKEGETL